MRTEDVIRLANTLETKAAVLRKAQVALSDRSWAEDTAGAIAAFAETEVCKVLTRIDDAIVAEKDANAAVALATIGLMIAKEAGNIKSQQFDIQTITPPDYVQALRVWRQTVKKELS